MRHSFIRMVRCDGNTSMSKRITLKNGYKIYYTIAHTEDGFECSRVSEDDNKNTSVFRLNSCKPYTTMDQALDECDMNFLEYVSGLEFEKKDIFKIRSLCTSIAQMKFVLSECVDDDNNSLKFIYLESFDSITDYFVRSLRDISIFERLVYYKADLFYTATMLNQAVHIETNPEILKALTFVLSGVICFSNMKNHKKEVL